MEFKAKTVHEAIDEAVSTLKIPQEDLNIEIIEQGGMFKKACIRATPKQTQEPIAKSRDTVESVSIQASQEPVKTQPKPATTKPAPKPKPSTATSPSIGNGSKFDKTTAFVTKLLELLGNSSSVTTEQTETAFNINVNGDNEGQLIGKNGSVLNALQALVSSVAISNSFGEQKRVFINVGDYRERRGDTLESMARKKAERVKETGRQHKFDPMNARDRAIVHTALQNFPGIKTFSTGKDPYRCLVIAPE